MNPRLPLEACPRSDPHPPHDHSPAASRHCPGVGEQLDNRHALYAQWIADIARANGVPVRPVVDVDGRTTNTLELELSETPDVHVYVVVPYPPADWTRDGN